MSASTEKRYFAELTPHTLRLVRAGGAIVEFYREVPWEQKPLVAEALAAFGAGSPARAIVAWAPSSVHWHLASATEAARYRSEVALRSVAAGWPHGFAAPLALTACHARDGAPVAEKGDARWLLGVTASGLLANEVAAARERGLDPQRTESATLNLAGAITRALRLTNAGRVLLCDLGAERSQMFLVTAGGVEGVASCALGFDAVFAAVQAALRLKFRAAASRLFYNESYDFSEAASTIGAALAPALQAAVAALPSAAPAELAFSGLTGRQHWLVRATAQAAGLTPWEPDVAKLLANFKLQVTPEVGVTAEALGALHLAASHALDLPAWHIEWRQGGADAMPAVIVPSSAARAETPAPAPQDGKTPAKPAPAPVAKTDRQPAPAKPEPAPVQPAGKGKKAPIPRAPEKPAPVEAAATVSAVAPQPTKEMPETQSESAPAKKLESTAAAAPRAETAGAPRKRGYGLYAGIAAGVVFALVAGKFYFDARAAQALAEHEKAEAARVARKAEERARELEARAKAEAERIRKEAEAAREAAVALARQQAEEQTRRKVSAEFEAERIANSPGILVVTTEPVGAAVSIDGGPLRQSPLSINDIMPGAHRVAIALPGYESTVLTAEIKGTQTTDLGLIRLERATGTLVVNSSPDGIDFTVRKAGALATDLGRTGRTPAQFDDMEPGDYVVRFTRSGWNDRTENATVAKRETARAAATFRTGAVRLTSLPSGATVKQMGTVIGTTPLDLPELAPGALTYELTLAGHEPLTISGEVKEGQQLRLDALMLSVDHIATTGEIKTPPQPIETPAPNFGGIGVGGATELTMSFVVWRDGTLREVTAVGAKDKGLAKRCVEAVAKWKFHPALAADGHPLNVRVSLPLKISTGTD